MAWRGADLPEVDGQETFDALVRKLTIYFVSAIETPYEWDELRRVVYGSHLRPLVNYLVDETQHPAIVSALLASKWHFATIEDEDDRGLNDTRGQACELVAWRFVTHMSHKEAIDALCYDLPQPPRGRGSVASQQEAQAGNVDLEATMTERSPLLDTSNGGTRDPFSNERPSASEYTEQANYALLFANLNALELAAVADAKKFLAQKAIQRIIDGLWKGDIVFWETMSTHSSKQAKIYRKVHSDPYCRLRVPLYLKVFEVMFFAAFLAFYYIVLVQKHSEYITGPEVMLYIWLASFTYNELGEYWDAGSTFYATDFWALWDVAIILVGFAFFGVRVYGLVHDDRVIIDTAFDILSVEALFLVPRIFSLLSLHPYFGMLIPALKEMTKDSVKFLGLVAILYMGFSTGLAFLARGTYTFGQMNWILIKVFFGSSYLGFDISEKISPVIGPPLMVLFVFMTNILLITSLISLLSNTLSKVMQHARDEYLFVYAVYVLEASTSNRLTYFLPPLNLLPLALRPLRLFLSTASVRSARIVLLKATHWPFVALIYAYESACNYIETRRQHASHGVHPGVMMPTSPNVLRRPLARRVLSASGSISFPERSRGTPRSAKRRPRGAALPEDDQQHAPSMASMVARLERQVQALTEIVAAQQQQHGQP